MRRPLLVSLMTLGLTVTVVGGMGVFAPFTDRATTGQNSVTSGARPRAADLQLNYGTNTFDACVAGPFADDSTTPGHTATDAQPGYADGRIFCVKNAGSSALALSVTAVDVVGKDVACTGDEAAAGDSTCGGDGAGELENVLFYQVVTSPCETGQGQSFTGGFLSSPPTVQLGSIQPGQVVCGFLEIRYPLNRTDSDVLQAQSDSVTWRYAFDGVTGT
jgi:predicted ribosomally synthesized peptide with SipW-like signal peptide